MRADVPLAPAEVRGRLFDALGPVRKLAELFMRTSNADPRLLRYVIQLHPLRVQVTLAPEEGRPAWRLHVFEASRLPDRGAALGEAVEQLTGALLASLPEETATATVLNAGAIEDGGLFVLADPTDETAILGLAGPGGSLGEAVYVGGLSDARPTVH